MFSLFWRRANINTSLCLDCSEDGPEAVAPREHFNKHHTHVTCHKAERINAVINCLTLSNRFALYIWTTWFMYVTELCKLMYAHYEVIVVFISMWSKCDNIIDNPNVLGTLLVTQTVCYVWWLLATVRTCADHFIRIAIARLLQRAANACVGAAESTNRNHQQKPSRTRKQQQTAADSISTK